jgi:hypothetical protein
VFHAARTLAETYFGVDVTPKIFEDAAFWDKLKAHTQLKNDIPLPLSNTPSAKHMRIAAFLTILSSELSDQLFQPTYVLESGEELSDLLSELAKDDALRGSYIRSVLLGTLQDYQKSQAQARANRTAQKVFAHFDSLFSSIEQRDRFKTALQKFCSTACGEWQHIQRVDDKIEFTFHLAEPFCNWKPFVSKASAESTPKQQSNGNGNGSTSGPSSSKKSQAPSKPPQEATPDVLDVVVWPGFYVVDSSGTETGLTPGYALYDGQVASAKAEEKAQLALGHHRTIRQNNRRSRTMSISASNGEGNTTSSGSFLSSRAGGGQKGA